MTTKLLHQIREQDQEELAARYNGETRRRKSEWVIEQMRKALPLDHIHLANRIMDLHATSEGVKLAGYERVQGGGNGFEGAMAARCDAMSALNGFEAAVRSRLGANGSRCFWAIAWSSSLAETIRACEYSRGSHGTAKRLVQLVMIAAQEYDDLCQEERSTQFAIGA